MKKMRRVSAWLMVLAMVCGLMGCAKEPQPTPEEVYAAAYEKVNSMTDMDAQMTMDMSMSAEGETVEMGLQADILMENPGAENMVMDMQMSMDAKGITMAIQAYYADGYYLMEMMGQKIKYLMPLEDAMGQTAMMQEVAVEALQEITMTQEEGNRVLNFTVDPEKIMEGYMDDYLDNMGLSDLTAEAAMKYETWKGTMTVNEEGYPLAINMETVFSMEVEGTVVECKVNGDVVYHNPGQDVTVEIPDASEYIEVDPETMS